MAGHPLSFGVMLMSTIRNEDIAPGFPRFTKAVELAETLKFDAVWTGQSYALGGPDSFQMLTHAASITSNLHFGTSVFLLPMRHPTTTALQVATLDQLSGGRFLFGVGVGGERGADFTLNGIKPSQRGALMDECLDVITQLWTGDDIEHHGRFYEISGKLGIKPLQSPMPVLLGARGGRSPQQQRVFDRVVKHGRGWLPYIMTPNGYARGQEALKERGAPDDLRYGIVEMTNVGDGDGSEAIEVAAINEARGYNSTVDVMRNLVLAGNPQQVIDRMNAYVDLGVTEFVFNWACDPKDVEDQMRRLAADVLPAVREHHAARAS
ncbi:MAG: LLM class flavin-dependent oxidoreductase [Dehalococcoidia bacterium]